LNQWTVRRWGVRDAVEGCARHGIGAIGLWREPVADAGVAAAAAQVRDVGLRVSSLCRAGYFSSTGWLDDNRAAIDEAAELSAACLVIVAGGLPAGSRDLSGTRARMADAIAELVPYARERGVRLALEPLHPMYCADRAVLSTLKQALEVAGTYRCEEVGVVVDTFHVWWDPDICAQIGAAGPRIASFQVSDMLVRLPVDVLLGRAMMGDGTIDFPPLVRAVADTGYDGDVEVEIFNADVWSTDPDEVITRMKDRYASLIAPAL
jgi:sugar phosphate isomerase/epimerase